MAESHIEFQRPRTVCKRIGYGKTSLWRMVKEGRFPAPLKIGPRAVAWPSDVIDEWQAEQRRKALKA